MRKYRRVEAGRYVSVDGRIEIVRHVFKSSFRNRAVEVSWGITIDGMPSNVPDPDTLEEAKIVAERQLV